MNLLVILAIGLICGVPLAILLIVVLAVFAGAIDVEMLNRDNEG